MNKIDNFSPDECRQLLSTFPQGAVAFDMESTGLSPLVNYMVELSAVKIIPDKISSFDHLLNPGVPISVRSTAIHGITDDKVKDEKSIDQVLPLFLDFVGDLPLIAHNAGTDIGFLVFNLHKCKLDIPQINVYCSFLLARRVFREFEGHGLAALCNYLDISLENHHRALSDAAACMKIFIQSLSKEDQQGNNTRGFLYNLKDFSTQSEFVIPEHLKGIEKYVGGEKEIEIKYIRGNYKGEFRPIRPVNLLPVPGGCVLYAYCLRSKIYKSFLLKRIEAYRCVD